MSLTIEEDRDVYRRQFHDAVDELKVKDAEIERLLRLNGEMSANFEKLRAEYRELADGYQKRLKDIGELEERNEFYQGLIETLKKVIDEGM